MGRTRLTDEERAARKAANWERILHGQKAPEGTQPGNPEDWIAAFCARMGLNEDEGFSELPPRPEEFRTKGPTNYFGLMPGFSLRDLQKAFQEKIMKMHPDYKGTATPGQIRECVDTFRRMRDVLRKGSK